MEDLFSNINIERSVLNSILFDPIQLQEVTTTLKAADFYLPGHSDIYTAMQELQAANKPIDEEFVKKQLAAKFEENLFLDIMTANPISNIKAYAIELQDKSEIRMLRQFANNILENINEGKHPEELKHNISTMLESNRSDYNSILVPIPLSDAKDLETQFICERFLPFPRKAVSLINAPGGTGKSFVALQVGLRHLNNSPHHKAFLWLSEDDLGITHHRAKALCTTFQVSLDLIKRLHVSDAMPRHLTEIINNTHQVAATFYEIKRVLKDFDLIVLDPLIAFFGGDENNNSHARLFFDLFTRWAKDENKTIIFIHHSTKSKEGGARGAGAISDAARLSYNLSKSEKDNYLCFKIAKDNYGAKYINNLGTEFERKIFPTITIKE